MVAVTYKEHLTEYLYVWANTALPPEFAASAACPPAGHMHDVTSVLMTWTECQSHFVSYGIMGLLFSNLLLFCSVDYIHFWQLWDLHAFVSFATVFCCRCSSVNST